MLCPESALRLRGVVFMSSRVVVLHGPPRMSSGVGSSGDSVRRYSPVSAVASVVCVATQCIFATLLGYRLAGAFGAVVGISAVFLLSSVGVAVPRHHV